jgi:hypothetical protein
MTEAACVEVGLGRKSENPNHPSADLFLSHNFFPPIVNPNKIDAFPWISNFLETGFVSGCSATT